MRLSIEISPEQHQFLKAAAAIQGKSIKDYVLDSALPTKAEQQAFEKLEKLLSMRRQKAVDGELSSKGIDEIIEEELTKA